MHKANQELSYFSRRYRQLLSGLLLVAAIGSTMELRHSAVQFDNLNIIQQQTLIVPSEVVLGTSDRSKYEVANGDTVWEKTQNLQPESGTTVNHVQSDKVLDRAISKELKIGANYSVPNNEELIDPKLPAIRVKFTLDDPELISLIKEAEGTAEIQSKLKQTTLYGSKAPSFRKGKFYPYRDPHGNYTIGYGHLISKTRNKVPQRLARGITKQEAEDLLRSDMERVYSDYVLMLQQKRATNLPREVQMALFEMTFNMGSGGVNNFNRMWSKLRKGQYTHASKELKNSAWSKQIQKERFNRLAGMISMKNYL